MRLKRFNEDVSNNNLKQFAITTKSESGDYYMYFVECVERPNHEEIDDFLLENGNDIEDGELYEEIEIMREITNIIKI